MAESPEPLEVVRDGVDYHSWDYGSTWIPGKAVPLGVTTLREKFALALAEPSETEDELRTRIQGILDESI